MNDGSMAAAALVGGTKYGVAQIVEGGMKYGVKTLAGDRRPRYFGACEGLL